MKIPKIKMLILDVDGTMTDNGIYIDENGIESKRFNAKESSIKEMHFLKESA